MRYFERLHTERPTLGKALEGAPLFIPSVCDCFTAMIAEKAGYPAMILGGEEFAGYYTSLPDIGLITPTELRYMMSQIEKVTNIPVIVDMANGFGNEMNAIRAAVDLVTAGAGGLILNDEVFPNRYGSGAKSEYLSNAEFENKVRAVADAIRGSGVMLIARTGNKDAGITAAADRMNAALAAGADIAYIAGLSGKEEAKDAAERIRGRKMFGLSRDLSDRDVRFGELSEMGYDMVTTPVLVDAAYCAYEKQLRQAYRDTNDFFVDPVDLICGTERREFLGLNAWLELGKKYNAEIQTASKTKALG